MIRTGFPWLLWSLAFWGTLKLSDAPILQDHSVCGIWGCGPPTNALLACHLGWMVFLAPSIPLAFRYFAFHRQLLSVFFWVLCGAGMLGVLGTGIHQLVTWYPNATELARSYSLRRWVFAVVTLTDFPMVQLFLYGLAGFGWQKSGRRTNGKQSVTNNTAATTVLAGSAD
jgi:hypothetical protein